MVRHENLQTVNSLKSAFLRVKTYKILLWGGANGDGRLVHAITVSCLYEGATNSLGKLPREKAKLHYWYRDVMCHGGCNMSNSLSPRKTEKSCVHHCEFDHEIS